MSEDFLTLDAILDLCQHQHRRIVLKMLAEEQRRLPLNDLTEAILKYNHQTPVTEASEDVVTEIRISLYHVQLPKLASEGLIDHDPERQLVEPTEQFDRVLPTLSPVLDVDPSLEAPVTSSPP